MFQDRNSNSLFLSGKSNKSETVNKLIALGFDRNSIYMSVLFCFQSMLAIVIRLMFCG